MFVVVIEVFLKRTKFIFYNVYIFPNSTLQQRANKRSCARSNYDGNSDRHSKDYYPAPSQVIVNSINRKIGMPNIMNLLDDVEYMLSCFSESRLEYCNWIINRDDVLVKMVHT